MKTRLGGWKNIQGLRTRILCVMAEYMMLHLPAGGINLNKEYTIEDGKGNKNPKRRLNRKTDERPCTG